MRTHPKVLGLTLDPCSHTAHTFTTSQYTYTNLQIFFNTHRNSLGKQKEILIATWYMILIANRQQWDRLWSMPLPYGRLLHARPALTNRKSCITQHWGRPQDAHKTQTYNICMTNHSHFPYTSTNSFTPHNLNIKHNIHHIPYTNIQPNLKKSYLHKVNAKSHPSPHCPHGHTYTHNTHHFFNCTHICTTLSPLDLWTDHAAVAALLTRWTEKLARWREKLARWTEKRARWMEKSVGGPQAGRSESPPLARVKRVGRQQH